MKYYSDSDKGPRKSNQDYLAVKELSSSSILACICDGVGGNNGGEVASKMATESFMANYTQGKSLIIQIAHAEVLEKAASDPALRGMATTLTALLVEKEMLYGVHAGDTRAYLQRGSGLKQLSIDHTEVAKLLQEGELTKEQAVNYPRKNVIYSALGINKELYVDEFNFPVEAGDRIMLMSDGVYGIASKTVFRDYALQYPDAELLGSKLIQFVSEHFPKDNYSLIVIDI